MGPNKRQNDIIPRRIENVMHKLTRSTPMLPASSSSSLSLHRPFALVCLVTLYVLFPLEVVLAAVEVLARGQHVPVIAAICIFGCGALVLDRTDIKARGSLQRRTLAWARMAVRFAPYEEHDARWEQSEGWHLAKYIIIPGALFLALSDMRTGNVAYGLKSLRMVGYLLAATYLRDRSHVTFFTRVLVCEQVLSLCLLPNGLQLFRRAIFVRMVNSALVFENLDELLLHLLPIIVWSRNAWLPLSMFAFVVFPFELFGFRSLIMSKLRTQPSRPSSMSPVISTTTATPRSSSPASNTLSFASQYLLYSAVSVPIGVVAFSYGHLLPRNDEPSLLQTAARYLHCALFLGVGSALLKRGDKVDELFPATFARDHNKTMMNKEKNASPAHFCWALTAALALWTSSTTINAVWTLSTMAIPLLSWLVYTRYAFSGRAQRWILLSVHILFFVVDADDSLAGDTRAVILALLRSALVFDDASSLSEICSDVALVSSLHLFILAWTARCTGETITSVSLVSVCAILIAVANVCSNENRYQLYDNVRKGENFLDHAVKQKYAGVGAALESILDQNASLSPAMHDTLARALRECHLGRDVCHMSALVRKSVIDAPVSVTHTFVHALIQDWTQLFGEVQADIESGVAVQIDAELLRGLLSNMSQGDPTSSRLRVRAVHGRVTFSTEALDTKAGLSALAANEGQFVTRLRKDVATLLGAEMIGVNAVSLPVYQDKQTRVNTDAADNVATTSKLPGAAAWDQLPRNLTFAVLDDNALVRKNVLRLALVHLHANPLKSFATGAYPLEAESFPREIIDRKIDIAIFDENLDYDNGKNVTGTDLLRIARENGFTGCAILHSANSDLIHAVDLELFDGFIEKTSKRQELIHGICKVWRSFTASSG